MSRIGNRIITVPENVTVEVKDNTVFVKGPKGELNTPVAKNINVEVKENTVLVTRNNEQITTKQLHGTTNANIANMINGVKDGYTILGGAEKLLKHFEKDYSPKYIRSYSDNDYFKGGIYDRLGFNNAGQCTPRYYWFLNGVELRREACQLKRLKDRNECPRGN